MLAKLFLSRNAPKKANMLLLFIAILAVALLSACGTPQSTPTAAVVEPTVATTDTGAAATEPAPATESAPAVEVSYSKDIAPLLDASCLNCHGGDRTSKGLSVKTYDELMAGSVNGAMIVAGDPAGSKLLQLVTKGTMPKRGEKLTASEVQMISDWIAAGAPNN